MDRFAYSMSSIVMTSEGDYGAATFASSLFAYSCQCFYQGASVISGLYIEYRYVVD